MPSLLRNVFFLNKVFHRFVLKIWWSTKNDEYQVCRGSVFVFVLVVVFVFVLVVVLVVVPCICFSEEVGASGAFIRVQDDRAPSAVTS